jgi:poly(3-hydroxybutyrate) depolymerase
MGALQALSIALTLAQSAAPAPGQIVPAVACQADATQTYALYLPAAYTRERTWPVIIAFDPGARGRTPVERYQAAAEQYGFIVAGSNNSRNGSPDLQRIISTLMVDVLSRYQVDLKRVYVAGMSGGARVAMSIALQSQEIAGVVASSAGFPDGKPRKTVAFPIFATAGTEDFNHLEMRRLDRELTSPHHLAVFEGGHVWLSSELATEAVEWLEVQAIRSGTRPRDQALIDKLFQRRQAALNGSGQDASTFLALQSIVTDFDGLADTTALAARAASLGREKSVRDGIKKDREDDDREERVLSEIQSLEQKLASDERATVLMELRRRFKELSDRAKNADDSSDRRLARRVLTAIGAGPPPADADYQKIINEYRYGRGRR